MPYFEFSQNNSGGSFTGPAIRVFVEADTPNEANAIAEANGLYFDGVADGYDCECCGDRWYAASDWNASDEVPEVPEYVYRWAGRVPATLVIVRN